MSKKQSQLTNFDEVLARGVQLGLTGDIKSALALFKQATIIDPKSAKAYYNLGLAYKDLGLLDKAVDSYKQSIKLSPNTPNAHNNLGIIYFETGDYIKAINAYEKAIRVNPLDEKAFNNMGNVLTILGNHKNALVFFEKALSINSNNEITLVNTGICLREQKYLMEAVKSFKAALKINPNNEEACANLVNTCLYLLNWKCVKRFEKQLDQFNKKCVNEGKKPPESVFANNIRINNPKTNLEVAKAYSNFLDRSSRPIKKGLNFNFYRKHRKKLKIGYITDGFRDFPTGHNITGVIEKHNKSKFEVFAFSYGIDDNSSWRKRVENSTHFVDLLKYDYRKSAQVINQKKIDILIDLKGHTKNSRERIIALNPAPIQVNLLGFAGSTGASYIDYFIGDKITISKEIRKHFSESIVFMPDTYWPTDNKLQISHDKFKKQDLNIPSNSFVYASLNQPYKIDPELFITWSKIIKKVQNSVLVIFCPEDSVKDSLINFSKNLNLDLRKLVFIDKIPKDKHLARIRDCVDIALDTCRVNGHTTTTDCLWAGVPIITVLGKHFMSRVSASMLHAFNLSELITKNLNDYQKLAISLATDRKKLNKLKDQVIENKHSSSLFDTEKYTKNLENAYHLMYVRYLNKQKPRDIIL